MDETNMMVTSPCCSPLRKSSKNKEYEPFENALSFMTLSPVLNGYTKTVKFIKLTKKKEKDLWDESFENVQFESKGKIHVSRSPSSSPSNFLIRQFTEKDEL